MVASGQSRFYSEQHINAGSTREMASGAVLHLSAGALIDAATATGLLTLATGAITNAMHAGNLTSGTIPLGGHLARALKLASAETLATGVGVQLLTTTGNPSIELVSTGDQAMYIEWASAQTVGIKLPPVALPADFSTAGGANIELFMETIGSATAEDANAAMDVRVWAGIGDTEMGSTVAISSAGQWRTVNITSGNVLAPGSTLGGFLNITLAPSAHAGRAWRLYDMRMRYERTS